MAVKRDMLKEKLFDPKAYNTIYISKADEEQAKKEQMDILIELLCDEKHKSGKNQVFDFLKREPKAVDLLMDAIAEAGPENKQKLLMATWEANVENISQIDMLTDIVIKDDFNVAMEALTCIENMHGEIPKPKAEELLNRVMMAYPSYSGTNKADLLTDLSEYIKNHWIIG